MKRPYNDRVERVGSEPEVEPQSDAFLIAALSFMIAFCFAVYVIATVMDAANIL